MKKYRVRVNCVGFEDIEVEAETKEEAAKLAEEQYQCQANDHGEAVREDIRVIK